MNDRRAVLLTAMLPLLLLLTCCVTSAQDKKSSASVDPAPAGPALFRIVFCADSKGSFAPCPT